jgi:hypothetical protein
MARIPPMTMNMPDSGERISLVLVSGSKSFCSRYMLKKARFQSLYPTSAKYAKGYVQCPWWVRRGTPIPSA